ncbi:hypothetical protein Poli38472_014273 [Pythium oligandrum]|uniref:Uncharacterized protein n=1 Tax=Pythium oligandrum TaxID=41045 RepID=A0A8K1FIS9_PYTOL|nr:hypothetical protein Poli38472_014273 [Pythium oligandrum]|eukprot:TMW64156.1 hypothetical protein Poli38472_014273 [Pythium oligandrum]
MLPRLLLTFCVSSLLAIIAAAGSSDRYHYSLSLENSDDRLIHLAQHKVGPGGFFEVSLDVTMTVEAMKADRGRNMLHLIVCDTEGVRRFTNLPDSGIGSPVSQLVPGFCAMANQTLDDLCLSYPLPDESADFFVYRSRKTIAGEWSDDTKSYKGDGQLYVFIDACETVGGGEGVLRSCLNRVDSITNAATDCFYCPKNYPSGTERVNHCVVPVLIRPTMTIQASMNLCDRRGSCLAPESSFLRAVYLGLALAWGVIWIVWTAHVRASREAMVDLQLKMKQVTIVYAVYETMTCAMLYTTSGQTDGTTATKLITNLAMMTQVFALAVPVEVIVLIAKGWKITRTQLDAREHQYIRFITMLWAISYTVLKNSVIKHLTVFLIWGVSWSSVVFMVWYNSAFNLNMLMYQIAMVRQLQLDTTRTPVFIKYQLFRRFRALLGIYMFVACIIGIMGLVDSAESQGWRASATAADEIATLCLHVMLGYTFRCRRFSNLIQAPRPPPTNLSVGSAAASEESTRRASTTAAVAPVGPGPVLPRIEESPKQKSAMVVVLNPNPQEQSLGMSYVPVNPKQTKGSDEKGSPKKDASVRADEIDTGDPSQNVTILTKTLEGCRAMTEYPLKTVHVLERYLPRFETKYTVDTYDSQVSDGWHLTLSFRMLQYSYGEPRCFWVNASNPNVLSRVEPTEWLESQRRGFCTPRTAPLTANRTGGFLYYSEFNETLSLVQTDEELMNHAEPTWLTSDRRGLHLRPCDYKLWHSPAQPLMTLVRNSGVVAAMYSLTSDCQHAMIDGGDYNKGYDDAERGFGLRVMLGLCVSYVKATPRELLISASVRGNETYYTGIQVVEHPWKAKHNYTTSAEACPDGLVAVSARFDPMIAVYHLPGHEKTFFVLCTRSSPLVVNGSLVPSERFVQRVYFDENEPERTKRLRVIKNPPGQWEEELRDVDEQEVERFVDAW